MGQKERAMVYPFDGAFMPVLRHKSLLEAYEIISLAAPRGWALDGRDAGAADGGEALGLCVSDDFQRAMEDCDTVILAETHGNLDFERFILPKLIMAIEKGKNIASMRRLEKQIRESLETKCNEAGTAFRYLYSEEIPEGFEIERSFENIESVGTSVIFIAGIAERTHKFHIQLGLREQLMQMGYRVSQIGTRGCCEALGFHSFPCFMYDRSLSETEKIVSFNRYVRYIEKKEEPDVIIIGIPGGIMPFNQNFTNKFAITAYEVSQAVTPDAAVLSVLYEDFRPTYLDMLENLAKYKLGFEIDCFNLANVKFDWEYSAENNITSYISFDSRFVDEKKAKHDAAGIKLYNGLNKADMRDMAARLVDCLAGYSDIKSN